MAPTGTHTVTDVPDSNLATVVAGFQAQGAVVTTTKQANNLWTVVATFASSQQSGDLSIRLGEDD